MLLSKPCNRAYGCALVFGLTAVLSSFLYATPCAAQTKKPVKPIPAKKPAAKKSETIVLGTTQLPGDFGVLGKTYTMGKSYPINFTLRSAEYSVVPFTSGNNTYVPKADEKLLVLHFTVQNPNPKDLSYDWSGLKFTVVDAKDVNHTAIQTVVREGLRQPLAESLKPAQKIDVVVPILVPAAGVVPKLIVERESGMPVIRYDLRGKVASLAAPFADAADAAGASALKEVPVAAGVSVPLGVFAARLDSVADVSEPILTREPGKGNRFVTVTFTIKNTSEIVQRYYWGYFHADLIDADGEKVPYTQAIVKATRDESHEGNLNPGEETRFRVFFALPANVAAKSIRLTEGKIIDLRAARIFLFDLTTAK
ncbi:MAG: DUF4352 domain-containing protein [Armatimonadetes bacterium]|nr:DUF4352 domain-containing protein [Armatimonadota bacterium]